MGLTRSGHGSVSQRGIIAIVVTDHLRHEHARIDAHGLVHDAALFRVIADFDIAREREILAKRVPMNP